MMAEMTGGNLENDNVNDQLLQLLTRKYQVLYVDYPRGVGRTTGPLPGDLLPETAAKDYDAVAEAAGVENSSPWDSPGAVLWEFRLHCIRSGVQVSPLGVGPCC